MVKFDSDFKRLSYLQFEEGYGGQEEASGVSGVRGNDALKVCNHARDR